MGVCVCVYSRALMFVNFKRIFGYIHICIYVSSKSPFRIFFNFNSAFFCAALFHGAVYQRENSE